MTTPLHDDIYKLVREPIDIAALARHVRAPEDGATVTFDGFVRNQSHNRLTLYLDYEAYESMALAKMCEIGAQLHEKYRIHRLAMVHRLGRLEITALAFDRERDGDILVFDPVRVPDGIRLSDDAILLARPGAYSVSVARRTGSAA